MRTARKSFVAALVATALSCTVAFAAAPGAAPSPTNPGLTSADCGKCHTKPVADIAANGGAHKTGVSCQDCHTSGHPPVVKKIIPQCSQCHEGKPHYQLKGCLGCHKNPHTPKIITFGNNVTDPCLSCHTQQIVQLKENKSKHTALNCSFCHSVHGKIPPCTQCHKPHAKEQTVADCSKCHKAHMPAVVTYKEVPNKDCGACHAKAFSLLAATKFKHKNVACVTCHQNKHKMIPQCQSCHGLPHPKVMHDKFPKCGSCHSIAHDLNNFPGQGAGEAAGAVKKAPAKKK